MTAPEQYIEITGPLLGELPEHYCDWCDWPVFMHVDGEPCPRKDPAPARPSLAALHRAWLDRGLPASTWAEWVRRWQAGEHTHDLNLVEVRMSDCAFGCKVWRCESCGEEMLLHSATYGCRGGAA